MAVVWRRNAQDTFEITQAIDFGVQPLLERTKNIFAQPVADALPGVPSNGWLRIAPSFGPHDPLPELYPGWYPPNNLPTLTLPSADVVHGLQNIPQVPHEDLVLDCGMVLWQALRDFI